MKTERRLGTKSPSFSNLSQTDTLHPKGGQLCIFGTHLAAQLYVPESVR
jgi:hypothetical protein